MWDEPAKPGGVIRKYIISILTVPINLLMVNNYTDLSELTANIFGLTPNTNYTVNISAVTVEPGDVVSASFTTPSCKRVIVLK